MYRLLVKGASLQHVNNDRVTCWHWTERYSLSMGAERITSREESARFHRGLRVSWERHLLLRARTQTSQQIEKPGTRTSDGECDELARGRCFIKQPGHRRAGRDGNERTAGH